MGEALAHRLPGRHGRWLSGPVGLGSPDAVRRSPGGCVIVADARVDNRDDLVRALRCDPTAGDAELIVAAYERWGTRCPEKLLGDWAFAIWDERENRLFCARDHMGVKPFYYHHGPGGLVAFASEIKALWRVAGVRRRINELAIGDYLLPTFEDKRSTFFAAVFRLPPGHGLVVNGHDVRVRPYWTLDPNPRPAPPAGGPLPDTFRELLGDAVRCRTAGSSPPGSFLSGGLDSSAITCLAEAAGGRTGPLPTFSATFADVPECDERPYIHAVLGRGRYDATFVPGDRAGPLADWERTLAHQDEPFNAPNLFIHSALYQAVRRRGLRVVLDGFDGDTTVSHGMAYLTELANGLRWFTLLREIAGLSQRSAQPLPRMLWRHGVRRMRPVRTLGRLVRNRSPFPAVRSRLVNPEFADRLNLHERHHLLQAAWLSPPESERADHFRRLTWGIIPAVLEVLDRAAAAEGVEPRYPFFDKRLVEFCLALPPAEKIGSGWTRLILRRAMEGILPPEVQWRAGKSDPGANFVRGLLRYHRELLDEVVFGDPGALEQYVDLVHFRTAYGNLRAGGTSADALAVWRGAVLSLWLRAQ